MQGVAVNEEDLQGYDVYINDTTKLCSIVLNSPPKAEPAEIIDYVAPKYINDDEENAI